MTDINKYRLELRELAEQSLKINSKVTSLLEMIDLDLASGNGVSAKLDTKKIKTFDVQLEDIRKLNQERQKRNQHFPGEMFSDPAWDIILCLIEGYIAGDLTTVSSIYKATKIPYSTVLRWVGTFEARGLLLKKSDPGDGRRIFIRPSKLMLENFNRWYADRYRD
ncbi:hypothetical protein BH11PSE5_BH11PSE5_24010 [soil metagenome]|uniref:hypothetical protein n=1 Tax=Sphingobium sp. CECT 9361 TaxID=2845384 RepID=UPI001E51036F|nr:hypothetical protein [Sphingobium sp. CECT 9361]CAH0357323.1 hypothetical protein SPH9361_04972 [Sphingobium sp. CECT 9361]|tara:strand:- start:772 stop:1266 length:495 start_codon:yes stop_codon:yes gene_type:complete